MLGLVPADHTPQPLCRTGFSLSLFRKATRPDRLEACSLPKLPNAEVHLDFAWSIATLQLLFARARNRSARRLPTRYASHATQKRKLAILHTCGELARFGARAAPERSRKPSPHYGGPARRNPRWLLVSDPQEFITGLKRDDVTEGAPEMVEEVQVEGNLSRTAIKPKDGSSPDPFIRKSWIKRGICFPYCASVSRFPLRRRHRSFVLLTTGFPENTNWPEGRRNRQRRPPRNRTGDCQHRRPPHPGRLPFRTVFEVNRALRFDRAAAFGMRLNIPAGIAGALLEPGDSKKNYAGRNRRLQTRLRPQWPDEWACVM